MSTFYYWAPRVIFLYLIALSDGSPFSKNNRSPKQDNSRHNEPEQTAEKKYIAVLGRGERDAEKRSPPCKESPPGVARPCILCHGKTTFPHTDDNGLPCECEACPPGSIVSKNCTCEKNGNETKCKVVEKGEGYMDVTNMCDRPYPCTVDCPGNQEIVETCAAAVDSKCDCPELTDQTSPTDCTPIPLCSENHERQLVHKEGYSVHVCLPCGSGMVQPYNNSDQMCQPKEKEATDSPRDDIDTSQNSSSPTSSDVDLGTSLPQDTTTALDEDHSSTSSIPQDMMTGKPCSPCICPTQDIFTEDSTIHDVDCKTLEKPVIKLGWAIVAVVLLSLIAFVGGRYSVKENQPGQGANGEAGMALNPIRI